MKYGIALVALLAIAGPVLFERHNGAGLDAVETGSGELNWSILANIQKERETRLKGLFDNAITLSANVSRLSELGHTAVKGWKRDRATYQAAYTDEFFGRMAAERVHEGCLRNGYTGEKTAAEFKAKMLEYYRNSSAARQTASGSSGPNLEQILSDAVRPSSI